MSNQTALAQELTILAQEDATGFQRIITSLEEKTLSGLSRHTCGYGKYYQGDWVKASKRAAEMQALLDSEDVTPMEDILFDCREGKELNAEQQEFLALCKQIQKEHAHEV